MESSFAVNVDLRTKLPADRLDDLVRAVEQHATLESVIHWGLAHRVPRIITRVVVQDEYTHDVVVRVADDCWLVYDTT